MLLILIPGIFTAPTGDYSYVQRFVLSQLSPDEVCAQFASVLSRYDPKAAVASSAGAMLRVDVVSKGAGEPCGLALTWCQEECVLSFPAPPRVEMDDDTHLPVLVTELDIRCNSRLGASSTYAGRRVEVLLVPGGVSAGAAQTAAAVLGPEGGLLTQIRAADLVPPLGDVRWLPVGNSVISEGVSFELGLSILIETVDQDNDRGDRGITSFYFDFIVVDAPAAVETPRDTTAVVAHHGHDYETLAR